jgi:hypothetical protein
MSFAWLMAKRKIETSQQPDIKKRDAKDVLVDLLAASSLVTTPDQALFLDTCLTHKKAGWVAPRDKGKTHALALLAAVALISENGSVYILTSSNTKAKKFIEDVSKILQNANYSANKIFNLRVAIWFGELESITLLDANKSILVIDDMQYVRTSHKTNFDVYYSVYPEDVISKFAGVYFVDRNNRELKDTEGIFADEVAGEIISRAHHPPVL